MYQDETNNVNPNLERENKFPLMNSRFFFSLLEREYSYRSFALVLSVVICLRRGAATKRPENELLVIKAMYSSNAYMSLLGESEYISCSCNGIIVMSAVDARMLFM